MRSVAELPIQQGGAAAPSTGGAEITSPMLFLATRVGGFGGQSCVFALRNPRWLEDEGGGYLGLVAESDSLFNFWPSAGYSLKGASRKAMLVSALPRVEPLLGSD